MVRGAEGVGKLSESRITQIRGLKADKSESRAEGREYGRKMRGSKGQSHHPLPASVVGTGPRACPRIQR